MVAASLLSSDRDDWCTPPVLLRLVRQVAPIALDDIGAWTRRMAREAIAGAQIIALLPARVDTAWWQPDVASADAICFWRGRLTFLGAPHPAPFPSAIACWGSAALVDRFVEVFARWGWIVRQARRAA